MCVCFGYVKGWMCKSVERSTMGRSRVRKHVGEMAQREYQNKLRSVIQIYEYYNISTIILYIFYGK